MQTVIDSTLTSSPAPGAGTVLLLLLLALLPAVIVYVWTALALSRVFAKLGVDGWKAWVPVYNVVVLLQLGGLSGWLLLLYLIPVFGQIFVYVAVVTAAYRISTAFGYGAGMTVLAALLFPVWATVLGFGDAVPSRAREAYRYPADEEADAAYRALSPEFGRPAYDQSPFDGRREVPPPPSAWIPAASPAPATPAPAQATGAAPSPSAPAFAAPAPSAPVPPVPSQSPADPREATPAFEAAAERPIPEPEPVTSWWMPAPEPEESLPAPTAPEPAVPGTPPSVPSVPADAGTDGLGSSGHATPAPERSGDEDAAPGPLRRSRTLPQADPAPTFVQPVVRDAFLAEQDAFPEESGAVSAVAGSPTAGAPRAAASSVSAFRPGMSDFIDDTVIAVRKRPAFVIELPDGSVVELTGDAAVLGRRPEPVHSAPGAQLITIEEETRTVSKTHALLRRQGESWTVSDLGSTNGVVVDDVEVEPGAAVVLDGAFLLGDAQFRLRHRQP